MIFPVYVRVFVVSWFFRIFPIFMFLFFFFFFFFSFFFPSTHHRSRSVMALRKLKHHEAKLLKKVDFLDWKEEKNLHQSTIVAKFGLSDRDEYSKYYAVVGKIQKLTRHLGRMKADDPFRKMMTQALLKKLWDMGLVQQTQSLLDADKVTVSSLCRRRLAIVLRNLKMCERLDQAKQFVQQGHVRIGPRVVLDPGVLVTRKMEDFVTWVDDSKIREKILRHNDEYDDYDARN